MRFQTLINRRRLSAPLLKWVLPALLLASAGVRPMRAQSLYWDSNGATAGAGATPTGVWGADAFWSTDPNGELATVVWTPGSIAVFSAGADGTGEFTINISANQTVAGLLIEEGTAHFTNAAIVLGAGNVTVNAGARLSTDSSLRINASAGATLNLNGGELRTTNPGSAGTFIDTDFAITLGAGGGTFSHTVPNILNIVQTASVVGGPGSLTKSGVGVLAFANSCTYSGSTIINDGELRIRTTANRLPITTPVIVNNPGILNLNSVSQQIGSLSGNGTVGLGSGTLTVGDATDTIFTGSISNYANAGAGGVTTGAGRVSKQGTGSLTFLGTNAFTGSLTNNAGNIIVAPNAVLCDPVADLVVNGGVLILSNAAQTVLSLSGTGGTVDLTTGHTLTVNPTSTRTFSGSIVGPGNLIKSGTGTLGLAGNNSYEGITFVNAGELAVSSATALGSTAAGTEIASGAELLFEGAANVVTITEPLRIAGPGSSDGGAITVQASANVTIAGPVTLTGDTTNTVSSTATVLYNNPNAITSLGNENLTLQGGSGAGGGGTISGVISLGSGGLTKQQSGRWTLSAANNYSGPTFVNAGRLHLANTTGSATGTGEVTVNSGATLSGPGSIAGTLIVNGSIAPGASPGTLNTGSEVWNGGASYVWEINNATGTQGADPGWDLVNINGTLTINATAASRFNVNITSLTAANVAGNAENFDGANQDYVWTILKTTGGVTGFDAAAFNVNASGFSNPLGLGAFVIELANGGNDLQLRFVRGLTIVAQPANQSAECATGTAMFAVSTGGLAPATYQWRFNTADIPGATAATLTVSPTLAITAGNYDVVISNNFGSLTSVVATLTLVDTAVPTIASCAPNQTLTANASCEAAIPDLTGLVDASDTCGPVTKTQLPLAGTMVGTGAHVVTITVTDAANNSVTCNATVTVNDTTAPTISVCAPNTSLVAAANCEVAIPDLTTEVTATDNCAGLVTITQSPLSGSLVGVGVHTVTLTATDVAGNSATCTATVTVSPSFTASVNSVTNCVGASAILTATTTATTPSYLWSPGGETTASITVSPNETTNYVVTVIDASTTCSVSATGTVTVTAALVVNVNSETICVGGSAILTASSAVANPTYLWSPGGETTASITVNPAATTVYSVTVTDSVAGCTANGSGTVAVNPLPVVSVNSETICAGNPAILTATTTAANPSYLWSPGGETTASITVNPAATTIYSVMVTDGATTCANGAAGTVTVTPLPSASVNSETICAGGTATLTAATSASNPSYLWSPGGATTDSIMVSPTETTVYTVTVTDGTTTCSAGASGMVTVNPLASVTVNSPTICVGDSATLTATTTASNPTYLWSPGGETTASITVTPGVTTAYSVTVTDGVTGCLGSGTGTVTVKHPTVFANTSSINVNDAGPASPYPAVINVTGETATVCRVTVTLNGISHPFPDDIDVVLVGPNGQGVLLMSDVGNADALSGVTLTFEDAASSSLPDSGVIASGSYKPTNYGAKEDGRPDNFPVPAPIVRFGTNLSAFAGINPNGNWSLYVVDDEAVDSGAIVGGWSIAITTQTPFADVAVAQNSIPNPVAVGSNLTFAVTVSNNGPADAENISLTDTLPAGVTFVSATPSQGSCTPGVGTVSCSLGNILAGGSATVNIVVVPSVNSVIANEVTVGSTTLDFVSANNSSTVNATVLDAPAITVQPLAVTACAGQPVSLSVTATGSAPLSYQWYKDNNEVPGATGSTLAIALSQTSDSGSYTVVVANSVGAAASTAAVVLVNPLPSVAVNSETICFGTSTILTATTSAANPSYLWSPGGETTASITVSPGSTTIYTVTVTDGVTTCSASASGTVTVNPLTVASALQSLSNVCPGGSVSFSTTATGTPPLSYVWRKNGEVIAGEAGASITIASVAPSDAGTYTVEVTGGCSSVTNNGTLTVAAPPVITAQPQNQLSPMGNSAVFSVTATGVAPVTYQWQLNGADITGATGSSLTLSGLTLSQDGGAYRVVVSNCAGSVTSVAAVLNVIPISGISFDWNTPGQFTNTPYNVLANDWLHNALPAVLFETPTGGVANSGALDLPTGSTVDQSSILSPVSYDFSLNGKTLVASTMVKIKAPANNGRNTQLGFVTATNVYAGTAPGLTGQGIADNNPQSFMTVILQSTAQPALTYQLRLQHRLTTGGITEVTPSAATSNLIAGNWYKVTARFVNIKGTTANTFSIEASLQDMGADGTVAGPIVLSYAPTNIVNADVANAKNMFLAFRTSREDTGVDLRDTTYAYANPGPVTFVAPPASQTVLQGRQATFKALVDGEGPYSYQWNKNGSPIPGAQNWKYTIPPALLSDNNAQFTVTVTGPANTVTSDPATLSVQADALALVSVGSVDGCFVGVRFNQPVDKATAENPANYLVNGVAALKAVLRQDGQTVVVTPPSMLEGGFAVTVQNVLELSGGSIGLANSANGMVAGLASLDINNALPAGNSISFAPNSFEITGGGSDIFSSPDAFRYVYTTKTGDFDVTMRVPYTDIVRAPSKIGFEVRASLDPTSPHVLAAVNPRWPARSLYEGTYRQIYASAGISWGAPGTPARYPDSWLRLRRVGNTFIRYSSTNGVNWNNDGQVSPVPSMPETVFFGLAVCAGANGNPLTAQFDNYGEFGGYPGSSIAITTQPAGATVSAGSAATLTVQATLTGGPAQGELSYVWQRSNGAGGWTNVPTAGATNNVLNTGNLLGSDNGAEYRVVVKAPGAADVVSGSATVTVTDAAVPTLVSAAAPSGSTFNVVLTFSEPVSSASATVAANYVVTNAAGLSMGVVRADLLGVDSRTVFLTTSSMLVAGNYGVVVNGVQDLGGNSIAPNAVRTFSTLAAPGQPVVVELYMGITGNDFASLTNMINTPRFAARTPDSVVYNSTFGFNAGQTTFPDTGLNNFGARIYSYFIAPSSGLFRIYMRNDDAAQFFMNTNAVNSTNPAGMVMLMQRATANANYATGSDQLVQNVPLVAGQRYYMEARFKEGTGGDGFAVFIQTQATTGTPGAASVIATSSLEYPAAVAPPTPVLVDYFGGFSTATPTLASFATLTNDVRWLTDSPDSFQWYRYNSVFGYNIGLADSTRNGYGTRLRSYFVAPSNGVYRFWVRVDDAAQLFMNTNAVNSTDPAGAVLLASQAAFNANYVTSAQNISLVGGQRYYTEIRTMEGGGGDGVMMTVRAQSDTATPPNTEVALANLFQYPVDLDRAVGAVTLAGITPVNPIINDGQRLVFSPVGLRGAPPFTYSWLKNGQPVIGNVASFTSQPLSASDNGAVFTLVVSNLFSRAERSSTVTVLSDSTPPTILTAVGSQYHDTVVLTFNEAVDAVSALCIPNYRISGGLEVVSVVLDPLEFARTRVILRTSPQTAGTTYTITVNDVRDASTAANRIAANTTVNFTAWSLGGCGFLVELFTNITGTAVANLQADSKYVFNRPDVTGYVPSFSFGTSPQAGITVNNFMPVGLNIENYGARLSGGFIAPSNGLYRFYIRGDDGTMLFMNTNGASAAGRVMIARNDGANSTTYDNGTGGSASPIVDLMAGQAYYIEALMKEGGGGDYVTVAVRGIDPGTLTAFGGIPPNTEVASGPDFAPFGNPDTTRFLVTQAPPAELFVTENDSINLAVVASILPAHIRPSVCYQWQRADAIGGVFTNIPGATGASYPFFPTLADDGARYRVNVSAPGTNLTFTTLLHVAVDAVAPYLTEVSSLDGREIHLRFNERVTFDSGTDSFNYSVNGGEGVVLNSTLRADGTSVILSMETPVTGEFTIDASSIVDFAASPNSGNSSTNSYVRGFMPFDVGAPAGIGSTFSSVPDKMDVIAGGNDIWGNADVGHLTLTPRYGDFDIHARVQSLSRAVGDTDNISKAGIMVRESTNANSRTLHLLVNPPSSIGGRDQGESALRINTGATTGIVPGSAAYNPVTGAPVDIPNGWIRLKRADNVYTTFRSYDGVNWITVASVAFGLPDQVLIGLATTAHVPVPSASTVLAEYRDIYIPNTPTILVQPSPANQVVPVHGTVTYSVVASNPPNSGTLTYQWRKDGVKIPGATSDSLTLNDVQAGQSGVYTVWVGNDGGATISGPATLTVNNALPVAGTDTLSTPLDVALNTPVGDLLANDTDANGDTVSILAVSGLYPASFVSDFNSGLPAGSAIFGSASAETSGGAGGSGYLRLNPSAINLTGSFILDELTPRRRVSAFTASFKLRISEGSDQPADGFSFNFAQDLPIAATTPAAAENGGGTGLSFCVDNYQFAPFPAGGTANTSGVKLRYGGVNIAGVQIPTWDRDAFIPVTVSVDAQGNVNVFIDGTNVFGNVVVPWVPRNGRFGFYARAGGQRQAHAIDDLNIALVNTVETAREASLGGSIYGNAYVDGGSLHLTDAAGSLAGSFVLNELTPGVPITSFSANFKLRIGNGSAEPADGFSFNFANDLPLTATTPLAAENGGGTGFSFCVDNYRFAPFPGLGGTANTSGMKILLGGVEVAGVQIPTWNSTAFVPVSISIASDGALTVLVDGTNVFGNLTLPVTPTAGRFGLYARTGGQFQTHWVDDLAIDVTTAGSPASYSNGFNAGGFGTVALADNVVTYSPPSGACGMDTYYYLATDGQAGSVSIGTVNVNLTVPNPQPPVILACPASRTIEAVANCQAAIPDLASTLNASDCATFVVTQSPAAGTLVGLGANVVTLTVSNSYGLTATCQVTVTVVDTQAPLLVSCATPPVLSAGINCSAELPDLRSQMVVSDTCAVIYSQVPAPGTLLPLGNTTVVLTATDSSGNSTNCEAIVLVIDATAPAIVCPADVVVACTGANGATANFVVTALDNCDANPVVTSVPASGSTFPIGTNIVTSMAVDAAGNTNTCTFRVIVQDSPVPTMTIVLQGANVVITWPQTCTPYVLEESLTLGAGAVWETSAAPVVPVGTDNQVTVPATDNKFYRLKKQP